MKNIYLLLFASLIFFISCNKTKKNTEYFTQRVWSLDSIYEVDLKGNKGFRPVFNVVKPKTDSTFGEFDNTKKWLKAYYFSGDTIYVKGEQFGGDMFHPYKYIQSDNKIVFKSFKPSMISQEYYFTDITDFFEGKPQTNENSNAYKKIKEKTWHLGHINGLFKEYFNIGDHKIYLHDYVVSANDGKLHLPSEIVEFIDSANYYKFTKNGFYVLDKEKKYFNGFKVIDNNDKKSSGILLRTYLTSLPIDINLIEIDPDLLMNYEDLPIGYRISCSEDNARYNLIGYLEDQNEVNNWYFDLKTLKFLRGNKEDCEFHFAITQRSDQFYDIYTKMGIKMTYLENGKIHYEFY